MAPAVSVAAIKVSFNSECPSTGNMHKGKDPFVGVVPIVHFDLIFE